jgi:hypothetical protein
MAQTVRDLVLAAGRPAGLRVSGLKVLGNLDLSYAEIKGPIGITNSEFTGDIDCSNAICVSMDLTDSTFPSLNCDGVRNQHDLLLASVHAELVVLSDAEVGGSLVLFGANLTGRDGIALDGDGLRVAGNASCPDGFCAQGTVRLVGASIGGQLNLNGGTLRNPDGPALIVDRARIGDVFCNEGFDATGQFRLVQSDIQGSLVLNGGRFSNPGGDAISADGARVAGAVFCGEGFSATGAVRLTAAQIDGTLELSGGTLSNPDGTALIANRMRVAGSVFCRSGFVAAGTIGFDGATIVGQLDLTGGGFSEPSGYAVSAERATIGTLVLRASDADSGAGFSLIGTHIGYLEDRPDAWRPFESLLLLDLTYDRINYADWTVAQRLDWLKKAPAHQNQPYEQLASSLRAQGHEREARRVLIAKHTQQRLAQPWYTRFPGLLFGGLLAYGYRPLQRTLPLLLVLYFLDAFLLLPQARAHQAVIATRVPVHATTTTPAVAGGQSPQPIVATAHCPPDYPCFSSWAYTLDVLVPLVNTHQTDYWTVISKHGDLGAIWYIRLAPRLAGSFLPQPRSASPA